MCLRMLRSTAEMTSFQDALRSTAADTVVFLANKEVDLKARFSKHVDMVQIPPPFPPLLFCSRRECTVCL